MKLKNLIFLIILNSYLITFSQSTTEIAKSAIESTVSIIALDKNSQPLGYGSGFIIEDELIATNVHVIEGSTSGYVLVNGQVKKYIIDGYYSIDKSNDLVILKVSGLKQKSMILSQGSIPEIGERIFAIGNPKGFNGTFSEGIISGVRNFDQNQVLQITAPISPGSSGGPVLNQKGEVVGIAFATYSQGQNLNFAIPTQYLITLKNNLQPLKLISTLKKSVSSLKTPNVKPNIKEGVLVRNIILGCTFSESFTYSIKNNLPSTISDVKVLILLYDLTGEIVDYKEETLSEWIKPFLAKTSYCSNRFDNSYKVGYKIKVRILDFKIQEE